MGDRENSQPPSKKRIAGREISRENPGLDDDDCPEEELGTFKKASEEVLAGRRIVRVRRHQPAASAAAASNPFASLQLVPPTQSSGANDIAKQSASFTEEKCKEAVMVENESNVSGQDAAPMDKGVDSLATETGDMKKNSDVVEKEAEKIEEKSPAQANDSTIEGEGAAIDKDYPAKENDFTIEGQEATSEVAEDKSETLKVETKAHSTAPLSTFQQLSSSQNAFSGLVGTGFAGSSFSFGSFPTNGSGFGGISGSLFGQSSEASTNSQAKSGLVMQEVPVETGEENEKAAFAADAILFEYVDGGWKERGKGEAKLNISTSGTDKARLVMRARGNYRLILNASLYADMKLANMDKKGITFTCANNAGEGKSGLSTFALKFKDSTIVDQFRTEVETHKNNKTAVFKTPENSPKASDDYRLGK